MSILGRVTRLFKSEVHGLLDSLEEPHAALKQAIREMEAAVVESEEAKASIEAKIENCMSQLESRNKRGKELEHQIDLSFEAENEKLSKSFVRKRLENQKHVELISAQLKKLNDEKQAKARMIVEQHEKLDQIKEKLNLFVSEANIKKADLSAQAANEFSVTEDEVELAYLEESKKRSDQTTKVSA
jgi:phage shock protein A